MSDPKLAEILEAINYFAKNPPNEDHIDKNLERIYRTIPGRENKKFKDI